MKIRHCLFGDLLPIAIVTFVIVTAAPHAAAQQELTRADIDQMVEDLSNWGRWGENDQLGALNLITPAKRQQAAALVSEGVSVSLARLAEKEKTSDNPSPFEHEMLAPVDSQWGQWFVDNCAKWLKQRDIAMLGSDAASDVIPSRVEGVTHPVHLLMLHAMGVHIFDNCDLEALSKVAAEEKRWDFLLTSAPIPVQGGTGSPLNPIATF